MARTARFHDRAEAGRTLGALVADRYAARGDDPSRVVVLGLPRGGVPVAAEVAATIGASLDVFVVRKVGVPGQPELAMGAVASGGTRVLNEDVIRIAGVTEAELERVTAAERELLARREASYRGDRPADRRGGKSVIVVDDGLATGASMRAAVAAIRAQHPRELVVAVPVAPPSAGDELAVVADAVLVRPHAGAVLRRRATGTTTSPRSATTRSAPASTPTDQNCPLRTVGPPMRGQTSTESRGARRGGCAGACRGAAGGRARVVVDQEVVGEIGEGLCVLVGVTHSDDAATARRLADKIWHLRVMPDDDGVMNRSVADTTGEVLVVSQFTLYGDTSAGRRPSWIAAARPEAAEPLVDAVVERLQRARRHRRHRPVPRRDGRRAGQPGSGDRSARAALTRAGGVEPP